MNHAIRRTAFGGFSRAARAPEPGGGDRTSEAQPPAADKVPADAPEGQAPGTPPVYFGEMRLFAWNASARAGKSVKMGLLDRSFTELHPFKGLSCGKENGQRFKVWVGRRLDDDTPVEESEVVYMGETILLFWSDDPTGMTVKLLLDDGPDGIAGQQHPFDGLAADTRNGERLVGVFWALDDQEHLQHPRKLRRRTPFFAQPEVTQASLLCRDRRFISYLGANEVRLLDGEVSEIDVHADGPAFAANVVRRHLGVESRSELSLPTFAGERARMRWTRLRDDYMRQKDLF